jgi:hypothetical protein
MLEYNTPAPHIALDSERDVVSQIKLAFANPLPLLIGALIGGLVPLATYTVGHAELGTAGWGSVSGTIVIGGCLFSAITVYKWGRRAFDSAFKALGFVVLSEGVMTFSQTPWLSILMLSFLVAINAVANGANLAVAHLDAERRRAASVGLAAVSLPLPLALQVSSTSLTGDPTQTADTPATRKPTRKRAARAKGIKTARGTGRAVVSDASQLN